MRIAARRMWVVECPSCRKPLDFSGEGPSYFDSKAEAIRKAELWLLEVGETLTEICGCRERRKAKAWPVMPSQLARIGRGDA